MILEKEQEKVQYATNICIIGKNAKTGEDVEGSSTRHWDTLGDVEEIEYVPEPTD